MSLNQSNLDLISLCFMNCFVQSQYLYISQYIETNKYNFYFSPWHNWVCLSVTQLIIHFQTLLSSIFKYITMLCNFLLFSAWHLLISYLNPGFLLILSTLSVPTLARDWPFNSDGVTVVAKGSNIWVVTPSAKLPLLSKKLLHRILTKSLCKDIFHTLCEKELRALNGRSGRNLEPFIGLPREEHPWSCILSEVAWSVFSILLPALQILKEFHQKLKPIKYSQNEKCKLTCYVI